jgi:Zn-dependent protease
MVPWLIQQLLEGQTVFYVSWVTTLIVGIVLHELSHGWAALWQGDPTPRWAGHMTPNPLVHMGLISILLACTIGLAWGMMPVDRTRFRGKYGQALVAAAGPLMNVLLAIVALVGLGLWYRFGAAYEQGPAANWQQFLWIFGSVQIVLAIFNLAPVPPLDGASILGNFHRGYQQWMQSLASPWIPFMIYFVILAALNRTDYSIWLLGTNTAKEVVSIVAGF